MPKVKIQKTFSEEPQKVYTAVKEVLTQDKELRALEPNLKVSEDKDNSENRIKALVSGQRVEGFFTIETHPKSGSSMDIQIKLPLVLSPFKTLVQKKIEEKLQNIS